MMHHPQFTMKGTHVLSYVLLQPMNIRSLSCLFKFCNSSRYTPVIEVSPTQTGRANINPTAAAYIDTRKHVTRLV